jgi:hypothetical protein
MKRFVAATSAVWMLCSGCASATALLSKQQARSKAINMLKGQPYGRTRVEVTKNIAGVRFLPDGNTKACGPIKIASWEFHVVVMTPAKKPINSRIIDGFLALDARTGKILCTNLPFLD